MASTAVVAGEAGGTASSVNEGVSGFRVDGSSVEQIAGCIGRLLRDDEFSKRLPTLGRDWVASNFSWDSIAVRTARLGHEAASA